MLKTKGFIEPKGSKRDFEGVKEWVDGWAEGWVDGRCVRHGWMV